MSDVVLYDSWSGKYNDNPRAIFEELVRRSAPFEHAWVDDGSAGEPPPGVIRLQPRSRQHLDYLARARYIVANGGMPGYFRKRRGTTFLQTWHGTPLKRLAFDLSDSLPDTDRYLKALGREVAQWDFLISPNRYSTEVFRSCFRYEGPILETGYPRNDLLSSPRASQVRTAIRESLGISGDDRVVLYAPTWRDGHAFELKLDLRDLTDRLGMVVLVRTHLHDSLSLGYDHPRIHNVSTFADIRELYLAADVLVTDYSSVMFDFAVTRKPMLFFTYDVSFYRDQLRGFYFDFSAEAPGPLLSTSAEVADALQNLADVADHYRDSRDRFHEKFCHAEDGHAAARVVDTVFNGATTGG